MVIFRSICPTLPECLVVKPYDLTQELQIKRHKDPKLPFKDDLEKYLGLFDVLLKNFKDATILHSADLKWSATIMCNTCSVISSKIMQDIKIMQDMQDRKNSTNPFVEAKGAIIQNFFLRRNSMYC